MSILIGMKMDAEKILKVGTRLEFFPDSLEGSVTSRIEDIRDNTIVAAMPVTSKGVPVIPVAGETMQCRAVGTGCYYSFTATYLDKGRVDGLPMWYVKMPKTVRKVQNREFVRVQVDYPIIIRPLDENGAMGRMIFARMTDISGGGVAISNDEPLPVNSKAVLELDNIPGVGMLRVTGGIVRCSKLEADGKAFYQIGIKFLDVSRIHQNKLVKFVFAIERQALAKGVRKK